MTTRLETTTLLASQRREHARTHSQNYMERHRAPFSLRCGALLIDYILLVAIIAFSTLVARMGGHQRASQSNAQMIGIVIAIIVAIVNLVGLSVLRGQTVGKWATGLRVKRTDGEPLTWARSLLRHVPVYPSFYLILGLIFLVGEMLTTAIVVGGLFVFTVALGFSCATVSAYGRALHDIIADTIVVRESVRRTRKAY